MEDQWKVRMWCWDFHVNNVLVLSNCYHGGNIDIHIWWDFFKMDFSSWTLSLILKYWRLSLSTIVIVLVDSIGSACLQDSGGVCFGPSTSGMCYTYSEVKRLSNSRFRDPSENLKIPIFRGSFLVLTLVKTSKLPIFRGSFLVLSLRWWVQKLVLSPACTINQGYQLKQMS